MGESAGGGSVLHHVTAYGGRGTSLFKRAIPQSGGFPPIVPATTAQTLQYVLGNASVLAKTPITTVAQLRSLPFDILYKVNRNIVGLSPYAGFTFSPVVDTRDSMVPALPFQMLADGKYHKVDVLVGHNSNEGFFRAPPYVQTETQFVNFVKSVFPFAKPSVMSDITTKFYPPKFDGSAGYTTQVQRTAIALGEAGLDCIAYWLASLVPNAYAYLFTVPNTGNLPAGIHGQDIAFTFNNGESSGFLGPVDWGVAKSLQTYLVNFVMTGKPTGKDLPDFIVYGKNNSVANIGTANLGSQLEDPVAKRRDKCNYWMKADYYP